MDIMDYLNKKYMVKHQNGDLEFEDYSPMYLNYRKKVRQKLEEVYADGHEPTLAELKDLNLMFKILHSMEQVEPDLAMAEKILPKLKKMYGITDGSGDEGQDPEFSK